MLNTAKLKQHSTKTHFIITKVHLLSNELLQKYLTCFLEVAQYHQRDAHAHTYAQPNIFYSP